MELEGRVEDLVAHHGPGRGTAAVLRQQLVAARLDPCRVGRALDPHRQRGPVDDERRRAGSDRLAIPARAGPLATSGPAPGRMRPPPPRWWRGAPRLRPSASRCRPPSRPEAARACAASKAGSVMRGPLQRPMPALVGLVPSGIDVQSDPARPSRPGAERRGRPEAARRSARADSRRRRRRRSRSASSRARADALPA